MTRNQHQRAWFTTAIFFKGLSPIAVCHPRQEDRLVLQVDVPMLNLAALYYGTGQ